MYSPKHSLGVYHISQPGPALAADTLAADSVLTFPVVDARLGQSGCQGLRCLTSVRSGDDRDGADSYLNSVGVIGDASWTSHGSTLFVWLKKPRVPIGGIERRPRRGGATYSRTNRVPGASLGDVMHRAGRAPDLPATSKMVDVPPGVTLNCICRAAEAIRRKVRRRSMRLPG
jgi:hypothetical protein